MKHNSKYTGWRANCTSSQWTDKQTPIITGPRHTLEVKRDARGVLQASSILVNADQVVHHRLVRPLGQQGGHWVLGNIEQQALLDTHAGRGFSASRKANVHDLTVRGVEWEDDILPLKGI